MSRFTSKFRVSPHAQTRLVERGSHLFKAMAIEAHEKGALLSDAEMAAMIEKGVEKEGYWLREYRRYKGLLWVFERKSHKRGGKIILITVL